MIRPPHLFSVTFIFRAPSLPVQGSLCGNLAPGNESASGYPLPQGWVVQVGSTTAGQIGQATHDTTVITGNAAAIDAMRLGLSHTVGALQGMITATIILIHQMHQIHQFQRANGITSNAVGAGIQIRSAPVKVNRGLASSEVPPESTGPEDSYKSFFTSHRDRFNSPDGNAQKALAKGGGLSGLPACMPLTWKLAS